MSKLRRYIITVDTELCGTHELYYAESEEDLEENNNFLDICEYLAYENYQNYAFHYSSDDEEEGYDIESDEYHDIELERYYYYIGELTDKQYEENKEYYNQLENIW